MVAASLIGRIDTDSRYTYKNCDLSNRQRHNIHKGTVVNQQHTQAPCPGTANNRSDLGENDNSRKRLHAEAVWS